MKKCKRSSEVIELWFEGRASKCRFLSSDGVTIQWKSVLLAQRFGPEFFAISNHHHGIKMKDTNRYRKEIIDYIDNKLDDKWIDKRKFYVSLMPDPEDTVADIYLNTAMRFSNTYTQFEYSRHRMINDFREATMKYDGLIKFVKSKDLKMKIREKREFAERIMMKEKLEFEALVEMIEMERVKEHCRTCGASEEILGIQCTCPCHTWEGRICSWCGGLVELDDYSIGVRLNLKGEETPDIKVTAAHCTDCGRKV